MNYFLHYWNLVYYELGASDCMIYIQYMSGKTKQNNICRIIDIMKMINIQHTKLETTHGGFSMVKPKWG